MNSLIKASLGIMLLGKRIPEGRGSDFRGRGVPPQGETEQKSEIEFGVHPRGKDHHKRQKIILSPQYFIRLSWGRSRE